MESFGFICGRIYRPTLAGLYLTESNFQCTCAAEDTTGVRRPSLPLQRRLTPNDFDLVLIRQSGTNRYREEIKPLCRESFSPRAAAKEIA